MSRSSDPFAAPDEPTRRREARQRSVELLYEAEMKSCSLAEVLAEQVSDLDTFARELATGVADRRDQLTARLGQLLNTGWSPGRLGACDRLILLQGLFELDRGAAPAAVVINEAVELAHRLGATDRSGAFVNGVLAAALDSLDTLDSP
ncbi:transcription antitermination factor NusB [Candidatus Poriferisodalis sp.]|uniref:transcription antitermination factor NusB n=1 Tax=Candidatus Poriferisodalis sp. TaxID=3101277 RepID=UPI003B01A2AE